MCVGSGYLWEGRVFRVELMDGGLYWAVGRGRKGVYVLTRLGGASSEAVMAGRLGAWARRQGARPAVSGGRCTGGFGFGARQMVLGLR